VLIFALFAVPLLALVAILWRRALLLALPLLTILNGLPLTAGGSAVRVDQLAACLLLVPLSASILSGTRRLRTDSTTWWLAAILALNVASSVMNSPARVYSLSQCANLASSWVIYVVLLNFLETREDLETFFRGSLWAAIAASTIGIIAFCLAIIGLPVGGADVSASALTDLTSAFGARGTLLEANIFGSLTGAYLVVALALLALAPRLPSAGIPVRLLRWTATLTATGLLLSFTRSAWIGTLAGIVFATLLGIVDSRLSRATNRPAARHRRGGRRGLRPAAWQCRDVPALQALQSVEPQLTDGVAPFGDVHVRAAANARASGVGMGNVHLRASLRGGK
jgi:hypothetical protein